MEGQSHEDEKLAKNPGRKSDDITTLKKEISLLKAELDIYHKKRLVYNEIAEEGLFFYENYLVKEVNEAFCRMTGYSSSELIGMHLESLFNGNSFTLLKDLIDSRPSSTAELQIQTKNITRIDVHAKAKSVEFGNSIQHLVLVQNITEFKNTRKSLEESEEKHRMISNLLSDYVYTCTIKPDSPPEIGWVSGAIENISGYTQKEIDQLDHGWFSVIHPEDVERIAQSVNYNYAGDDIYENEYRIIDKSGKVRWLIDRSRCISMDKKTKELTLLGATKDISDRKEIEESLKEKNKEFISLNKEVNSVNKDLSKVVKQLSVSEEKYRNLIENAKIGVGISKDEQLLYANKSLLDIYQVPTLEDFTSKKLTDYMPPESQKFVKDRLKKYKKKIPLDKVFRHQIIRSDGKIRTIEIITNDVIYNGKECRQALITDVTPQIETENALQRAASIFDNIQIGIMIYRLDDLADDHSLRLIAINPESLKLIGIKGENLLGKTIDEIFPNLRKNRIPQQYAEVARNKIPVEFDDIYYEDTRVSPGIFSVKVFPLPDQCVGISFENVSERRKAEKELLTRNHELNNFVYKVSHDLRAPLSSIKGLINLSRLEQNFEGYLTKIEDRINHLDGFIHDILSHSRNLNSAIIIEKINLQKILHDCVDELKYLPGFSDIDIQINVIGTEFYSDKIRVTEICRNIVSNSIKYQDTSKSKKLVLVETNITPEHTTIVCQDNGIGIKQEYLNDIFQMFYRATEEAEGSGIGLYIVQQALEKLNGTIQVESEFQKGTTFRLSIPNLISKKQD